MSVTDNPNPNPNPDIARVPISYGKESNVAAEAYIDTELLPYVMRFKWYLSNPLKPSTPKTQLRVNGVPKAMLLNRLVYTLGPLDDTLRDRLTSRASLDKLFELVEKQPRLQLKLNNDHFDCRIANIDIRTKGFSKDILAAHIQLDALSATGNAQPEPEPVNDDELGDIEQILEARNKEIQSQKLDAERKKHELPDDFDALAVDPLGIFKEEKRNHTREEIEASAAKQENMLGQVFGLMDQANAKGQQADRQQGPDLPIK